MSTQNHIHVEGDPSTWYVSASEPEQRRFREWVKGVLADGRVAVDFIKATGEQRTMVCTTSAEHGAVYTVNENAKKKKPNDEVCVVWDCTQNAWRSFRWDRVKKIEFTIG